MANATSINPTEYRTSFKKTISSVTQDINVLAGNNRSNPFEANLYKLTFSFDTNLEPEKTTYDSYNSTKFLNLISEVDRQTETESIVSLWKQIEDKQETDQENNKTANTQTNGGTVGGIVQHDGKSFNGLIKESNLQNEKSHFAVLNTCLADQLGFSSESTGMGASYSVAKKMKNGATFGQAFNATHGEIWAMGGNQTMNRTGAQLSNTAGSKENPGTFAIALVDPSSGSRFSASGNTLKEIARGAGVPESNILVAHNMKEYNEHIQKAIKSNQEIVNKLRSEGKLGAEEKYGGLIALQHSHGTSNGRSPEAVSFSSAFGHEDAIEKPLIEAKLKGNFAWGASMNGSCHSGGFDGYVAGLEATEKDKIYQEKGIEVNRS